MFSVSRPMLVVVLNCWVTLTTETPLASSVSMILAKSSRLRLQAVDLVDHDAVDLPLGSTSAISRWNAGRSMLPPENPPSS